MKFFTLLFTLLFCLALQSCQQHTPNSTQNATTDSTHSVKKGRSMAASNDFKLKIEVPKLKRHKAIYLLLQKEDIFQKFIHKMNERVAFPGEITIEIVECTEVNAFYYAETSTISICFEFLHRMMSIQEDWIPEREKLLNAAAFIFLHEMGHALVDKLEIPITGKEENAVDELAMLLMVTDEDDQTMWAALEGVLQFYQDALEEDFNDVPFHDTHAPNIERYFDMVMLLIGAHPDFEKDFVGTDDKLKLPPERAENAKLDFERKLWAWKILLGDAWRE
jgi:Putative metallopeptidase